MASHKINHSEWDLLDALWSLGPTTAPRVAEHVHAARGWAKSTVKTMLDRMVTKGLLSARQIGTAWEYTPTIGPDQAKISAWERFVDAAFGGATAPALHFVVSEAKLNKKQREALLAVLQSKDERKKNDAE